MIGDFVCKFSVFLFINIIKIICYIVDILKYFLNCTYVVE